MIASTQGIDQCRFPGSCARGWVNHDRVLRLENSLHVGHHQILGLGDRWWASSWLVKFGLEPVKDPEFARSDDLLDENQAEAFKSIPEY
jgi:hypothetical protein